MAVDNPEKCHAADAVETLDHIWITFIWDDAEKCARVGSSRKSLNHSWNTP